MSHETRPVNQPRNSRSQLQAHPAAYEARLAGVVQITLSCSTCSCYDPALALFEGRGSMSLLPKPEIVNCFFDESVAPHLPGMVLRWVAQAPAMVDAVWHLPEGVVLRGAAPERFGVTVERRGPNA